jgi:hypothetical protein
VLALLGPAVPSGVGAALVRPMAVLYYQLLARIMVPLAPRECAAQGGAGAAMVRIIVLYHHLFAQIMVPLAPRECAAQNGAGVEPGPSIVDRVLSLECLGGVQDEDSNDGECRFLF